jgi:hypothetical protein
MKPTTTSSTLLQNFPEDLPFFQSSKFHAPNPAGDAVAIQGNDFTE